MLQIKRYNSLNTFPSNTSHNITTLVSKIRKIHKNLNPEKLDITIFENQLDEKRDTSTSFDSNDSSNSNISNLSNISNISPNNRLKNMPSIKMLRGRSSSPTFGRRGRINDESDSSFDEKISLINGTLQRRRTYRPVSRKIFDESETDSESENSKSKCFFSEKSLYLELQSFCNNWEIYENEKEFMFQILKKN